MAQSPSYTTDNLSVKENCVKYSIFLVQNKQDFTSSTLTSPTRRLNEVLTVAKDLSTDIVRGYIWQQGSFSLQIKSEEGLDFLHGSTNYGDCVEDEWLIVYLLRQLSLACTDIWIRVFDEGGEFLLVEAANVLPRWINPEIDNNRVWLHQGQLLLIPIEQGVSSPARHLLLSESIEFITSKPDCMIHSSFVEAEAFFRLEKYPRRIQENDYYTQLTVPRKLAYLLHLDPATISTATNALCSRDAAVWKAIFAPGRQLAFPLDDMVTTSVQFTKLLYVQLRSQRLELPPDWMNRDISKYFGQTPAESEVSKERLDMSMKTCLALELLVHISKESTQLLHWHGLDVLRKIENAYQTLPTDDEIQGWEFSSRQDSTSWLDIDFAKFEEELEGKKSRKFEGGSSGFGSEETHATLQKMVSRFEDFLNDKSAGPDGADFDGMDINDSSDSSDEDCSDSDGEWEEDEAVSFNEAAFSQMMSEMMGMPVGQSCSNTEKGIPELEVHGSKVEDENSIHDLIDQMERELELHGALKTNDTLKNGRRNESSLESKLSAQNSSDDEGESQGSDDEKVDIDYNLAKNLLESFKSQDGLAGPAGNMLGMLGLRLPRDDEES